VKKILPIAVLLGGLAHSQYLIDEMNPGQGLHLRQTDMAALESIVPRSDLRCNVVPIKPKLDLDFVFHSGFRVNAQLKDLNREGQGNELTTVFRVISENSPDDPTYMSQKVRIPPGEANERHAVEFEGAFVLGEGKYRVDWLMRDKEEHVCSSSWETDARLAGKETSLTDWVPKGLIRPDEKDVFRPEPPGFLEPRENLLNVDIIVNFSPGNPNSVRLAPNDIQSVVDILHRIARDPNIGSFSLVVCSLAAQKVIYRQEPSIRINFPAIGDALTSLKLGSVAAKQLATKDGITHFIADIIRQNSNSSHADAVVLVGTKTYPMQLSSREIEDSLKELDRPFFYLYYNADPHSNPWADPLGSILRRAHALAYEVTHPRDLFNVWSDVVSRIMKAKQPAGD
jgi:hypothetical protein